MKSLGAALILAFSMNAYGQESSAPPPASTTAPTATKTAETTAPATTTSTPTNNGPAINYGNEVNTRNNTTSSSTTPTAAETAAARAEAARNAQMRKQLELQNFKDSVKQLDQLHQRLAVTPIDSDGPSPVAMKTVRELCKIVEGRLNRMVEHLRVKKPKVPQDPTIFKGNDTETILRLLRTLSKINPQLIAIANDKFTVNPTLYQKLAVELESVRQLTKRLQQQQTAIALRN